MRTNRIFRIACMFAMAACSGGAGRDPVGEGIDTPRGSVQSGEDVASTMQAIDTPEATVQAVSGENVAESASAAMIGTDGSWQTVVNSNIFDSTMEAPRVDYGCVNGSNTFCEYNFGNVPGIGSDTSMVVGGGFMYEARIYNNMTTGQSGTRFRRNQNPCPTGCGGVSWPVCLLFQDSDAPKLVSADASTVWTVFNDFAGDANSAVSIMRLSWCTSGTAFKISSQCGVTGQDTRNPRGVLGGNGLIHVVFSNETTNQAQYMSFNTVTNKWSCNVVSIGPLVRPTGVCSSGERIMPTIGNQNLEFSDQPSIARDPVSGTLIASWDTYESSVQRVRSRTFISTDSGASWTWKLWTNAESGHSALAVGPNHRVEMADTLQTVIPGNQVAQARWKSTDAGNTWAGLYISAARDIAPENAGGRACFWGDYDGVTYNQGNDAFFHSWYDNNQGPNSVIRGRFSTN